MRTQASSTQKANYNLQGGLVKKTEGQLPAIFGVFVTWKWLKGKGIMGNWVTG